jgi:hypothetical protein
LSCPGSLPLGSPVLQRTLLRVDAIDQRLLAALERLPVA